jgi:hypothetical protein
MAYEPRGKVLEQIERMRAEPDRTWQASELAVAMNIAQGNVTAYLQAAITHGLVHRKLESGKSLFRITPFPADTWKPPSMTPPRGESRLPATRTEDLPRAAAPRPVPTPAPGRVDPPAREIETVIATPQPIKTKAPLGAASWPLLPPDAQVRTGTNGATIETQPAAEAEEGDPEEFDAARWANGDVDLYGLLELEGAGHRIEAKNVPVLLRLLGVAC